MQPYFILISKHNFQSNLHCLNACYLISGIKKQSGSGTHFSSLLFTIKDFTTLQLKTIISSLSLLYTDSLAVCHNFIFEHVSVVMSIVEFEILRLNNFNLCDNKLNNKKNH